MLSTAEVTSLGNFSRFCDIVQDVETISCTWRPIETGQVHWGRRPCLVEANLRTKRVVHRLDPAVCVTTHHHITDLKLSSLDHDLRDDTSVRLLFRFETHSGRCRVGTGLKFVEFRGGQQHLKQIVDAVSCDRAGANHFDVSSPFTGKEFVSGKILQHLIRVGTRQIAFIQGHHDRHFRRLGMGNRFLRLRHDSIVGRNHQNSDVCDVGTSGTHFGKGFVARRIDEGDFSSIFLDGIGPYVLGNSPRFA